MGLVFGFIIFFIDAVLLTPRVFKSQFFVGYERLLLSACGACWVKDLIIYFLSQMYKILFVFFLLLCNTGASAAVIKVLVTPCRHCRVQRLQVVPTVFYLVPICDRSPLRFFLR